MEINEVIEETLPQFSKSMKIKKANVLLA